MYDPFYNTGGAQYNPMWIPMPPGFSPMPAPGPFGPPDFPNFPDFLNPQGIGAEMNPYPPQAQAFGPPPPPNFSGFFPGY